MILLRNLAFYGVFYGGSVVFTLLSLAILPISPAGFKVVVHGWSGLHRFCVTRILGCEVVVEGAPLDRPVLYAIKHESFFEAIDAPNLFEEPVIFAKQELLDIPAWGRAGRLYGLIGVQRDAGARALMVMIREARAMAARGRPLVIFPEGTRIPHGTRPPLRSGFAGLYKMLGLPVVPVAVDSGPLYHRGLKRRGRITYRFGETIEPGLARADIEARVHQAINALNI